MINNAANKLISTNLQIPQMGQTIVSWFLPIEFGIVSYSLVDFEQVLTINKILTKGVVQPASEELLELLPEGDRSWKLLEIHCLPDLILNNGEFIFYKDLKYKVLRNEDFSDYGYRHYLITEAFENE